MILTPRHPVTPPSLLTIIVLYKTNIQDSVALRSLREAEHALDFPLSLQILIYDNTPGMQTETIPQDLIYIASEYNRGLSAAYNEAIRIALQGNVDWLLTLDQDTTLPVNFLSGLARILVEVTGDASVAGVVPRVCEGKHTLSPHWFALDIFKRSFPAGFDGVPRPSVYAFNSGSTLRLSALVKVGGYNELFWLDYSDAYIFRQLHHYRFRVFVAGTVILQHQLSLLDTSTRLSDTRFLNILEAGSAFCDMMRGPLVNMMFTVGLVKSYFANLFLRPDKARRRSIATVLSARMFHRKLHRLRRFAEQRAGQGQSSKPAV